MWNILKWTCLQFTSNNVILDRFETFAIFLNIKEHTYMDSFLTEYRLPAVPENLQITTTDDKQSNNASSWRSGNKWQLIVFTWYSMRNQEDLVMIILWKVQLESWSSKCEWSYQESGGCQCLCICQCFH